MSESSQGGKDANRNIPRLADGSIDVESIRIKILIICKNKKGLSSLGTYLTRRGWETVITQDLKEAFKLIAVFNPDFILLSVNVESQKLAQLPTVFYSTFKTFVITFAEQSDTPTVKLMQTIAANFKINSAVSGPSVHRRIKQLLQEQYDPDAGKKAKADGKGKLGEGSNLINFQTEKGKDRGEEKSEINGENNSSNAYVPGDSSAEKKDKNSMYFAKGEKNLNKRGNAYMPGDQSPSGQGGGSRKDEEAIDAKLNALIDEYAAGGSAPNQWPSDNSSAQDGSNESNQRNKSTGQIKAKSNTPWYENLTKEEKPKKSHYSDDLFGAPPEATSNVKFDLEKNNSTGAEQGDSAGGNQGKPKMSYSLLDQDNQRRALPAADGSEPGNSALEKLSPQKLEWKSAIESAVSSALSQDMNSQSPQREKGEEGILLPVLYDNKTSYLFISVSMGHVEELMFFSRLRSRIEELGKKYFGQFSLDEEAIIDISNMDLTQTVAGQEFQIYFEKQGYQVLIKSIVQNTEEPKLGMSQDASKHRVEAEDLITDTAVGVNVFLFLPMNNKYYNYIKPATSVSRKQKEKLVNHKVDLYINKEDAEVYKKYLMRNRVIDQIKKLPQKEKKSA